MVQTVDLPNGDVAEFPDEMDATQIQSIIQKQFPAPQRSAFQQATSPFVNYDYLANQVAEPFNQTFEKYVANPAMGAIGGFSQGLANIAPGLANLGIKGLNLIPGANIQEFKGFHFLPERARGGLGEEAGEAASYIAGPGALRGISKAADLPRLAEDLAANPQVQRMMSAGQELVQGSPFLQKAAEIGGSVGKNALAGAVMTPEHQLLGSVLGGLAGAIPGIGQAIGYGKEALTKAIAAKSPEKHAKELINQLGEGSNTYQSNTESMAKDLRDAFQGRKKEAQTFFNHTFERAGNENIFDPANPLISTAKDELKDVIDRAKSYNLDHLFKLFERKPNVKNAHFLKAELGDLIGEIEAGTEKKIADFKELGQLKDLRDNLDSGIRDYLKRRDSASNETLFPMYERGVNFWRDNVEPYLTNSKLRDILLKGKTVTPKLEEVFKMPHNVIDPITGEEKIGPINKIMQDLPSSFANKILFNAAASGSKNSEELISRMTNAQNEGFSPYMKQELLESLMSLHNKMQLAKKTKKTLGYAGLGALTTSPFLLSYLFGSSPAPVQQEIK